jgi:hypothetical protein
MHASKAKIEERRLERRKKFPDDYCLDCGVRLLALEEKLCDRCRNPPPLTGLTRVSSVPD